MAENTHGGVRPADRRGNRRKHPESTMDEPVEQAVVELPPGIDVLKVDGATASECLPVRRKRH
jgi:hypothetical protein